jgi:hypothetical protein
MKTNGWEVVHHHLHHRWGGEYISGLEIWLAIIFHTLNICITRLRWTISECFGLNPDLSKKFEHCAQDFACKCYNRQSGRTRKNRKKQPEAAGNCVLHRTLWSPSSELPFSSATGVSSAWEEGGQPTIYEVAWPPTRGTQSLQIFQIASHVVK